MVNVSYMYPAEIGTRNTLRLNPRRLPSSHASSESASPLLMRSYSTAPQSSQLLTIPSLKEKTVPSLWLMVRDREGNPGQTALRAKDFLEPELEACSRFPNSTGEHDTTFELSLLREHTIPQPRPPVHSETRLDVLAGLKIVSFFTTSGASSATWRNKSP